MLSPPRSPKRKESLGAEVNGGARVSELAFYSSRTDGLCSRGTRLCATGCCCGSSLLTRIPPQDPAPSLPCNVSSSWTLIAKPGGSIVENQRATRSRTSKHTLHSARAHGLQSPRPRHVEVSGLTCLRACILSWLDAKSEPGRRREGAHSAPKLPRRRQQDTKPWSPGRLFPCFFRVLLDPWRM